MKKIIIFFISISILGTLCGEKVFANSIYIADEQMSCEYKEIDGKKILPIREFCEELGYDVIWNEQNSAIIIKKTEESVNKEGYSDLIILVSGCPGIVFYSSEKNKVDMIDTLDNKVEIIEGKSYMTAFYLCRALDISIKKVGMQENRLDLYNREQIN